MQEENGGAGNRIDTDLERELPIGYGMILRLHGTESSRKVQNERNLSEGCHAPSYWASLQDRRKVPGNEISHRGTSLFWEALRCPVVPLNSRSGQVSTETNFSGYPGAIALSFKA